MIVSDRWAMGFFASIICYSNIGPETALAMGIVCIVMLFLLEVIALVGRKKETPE